MQTCLAEATYDPAAPTPLAWHNAQNVFSVVRVSLGTYRATWSPAFVSDFYNVFPSTWYTADGHTLICNILEQTTTYATLGFIRRDNGDLDDPQRFSVMAMGAT